MKTREEQLESCKICMKRKFIMEKGLVCSLTNEWGDFDEDCPDFKLDKIAKDKEEFNQAARNDDSLSMETAGLHRIGIKNGAVAGLIILGLGLAWLIGGIIYMEIIFYYSFVVILVGGTLILNYYVGLNKKRKKEVLMRKQDDILDAEN